MSASLQKEDAQRSAAQLGEEIRSLDESAAALGQAAADPEIDWETKARQASEQEGECSRQILAIAGQLSACRARTAEARRQRARRSAAATMALLLGCISLVPCPFSSRPRLRSARGLAGLVASAVCFSVAAQTPEIRARRGVRRLETGRRADHSAGDDAGGEVRGPAGDGERWFRVPRRLPGGFEERPALPGKGRPSKGRASPRLNSTGRSRRGSERPLREAQADPDGGSPGLFAGYPAGAGRCAAHESPALPGSRRTIQGVPTAALGDCCWSSPRWSGKARRNSPQSVGSWRTPACPRPSLPGALPRPPTRYRAPREEDRPARANSSASATR